jgi:hypothetical protein
MDVADVVAQAPEGATFSFAPGIYRQVSIVPRDNQVFLAEQGAILDGEQTAERAFSGPANLVTIRGFEIVNYQPLEEAGFNHGAITSKWYESQSGGDSWLVEDVDVHHNRGAGIMLTNRGVIRNSSIHHNFAIGIKLAWAPDGGLVEGNEIAYNNFDSAPDFDETGGSKFALTTDLIVRDNWVHHNNGAGLWTDIDNYGTVYVGNLVDNNAGPGIEHEISYAAVIRNNIVRRNGHNSQGWMWGAGILIANSSDVTVEGNKLYNNGSGLGVIHQDRGHYATANINLIDNQVVGTGWSGAVQDVGQSDLFFGLVRFEGNYYLNASKWIFGDEALSWKRWQGLDQDLAGVAA